MTFNVHCKKVIEVERLVLSVHSHAQLNAQHQSDVTGAGAAITHVNIPRLCHSNQVLDIPFLRSRCRLMCNPAGKDFLHNSILVLHQDNQLKVVWQQTCQMLGPTGARLPWAFRWAREQPIPARSKIGSNWLERHLQSQQSLSY